MKRVTRASVNKHTVPVFGIQLLYDRFADCMFWMPLETSPYFRMWYQSNVTTSVMAPSASVMSVADWVFDLVGKLKEMQESRTAE